MGLGLIIFIVIAALLVGGIFSFMAFRHLQEEKTRTTNFKRAELERRAKTALWTGATIVSARAHTSAEDMRESVRVDLTLQITPSPGEPYTARTSWRVKLPLLSQFQSGASLSVKVDKDDPDLIFPNQPDAEFWS